jgi:hypothetical protein
LKKLIAEIEKCYFFLAKIENKFAEPDVNVLTAQSSLSCSGYTASLAASSHHHQPPLHLAVAGKEWEKLTTYCSHLSLTHSQKAPQGKRFAQGL